MRRRTSAPSAAVPAARTRPEPPSTSTKNGAAVTPKRAHVALDISTGWSRGAARARGGSLVGRVLGDDDGTARPVCERRGEVTRHGRPEPPTGDARARQEREQRAVGAVGERDGEVGAVGCRPRQDGRATHDDAGVEIVPRSRAPAPVAQPARDDHHEQRERARRDDDQRAGHGARVGSELQAEDELRDRSAEDQREEHHRSRWSSRSHRDPASCATRRGRQPRRAPSEGAASTTAEPARSPSSSAAGAPVERERRAARRSRPRAPAPRASPRRTCATQRGDCGSSRRRGPRPGRPVRRPARELVGVDVQLAVPEPVDPPHLAD